MNTLWGARQTLHRLSHQWHCVQPRCVMKPSKNAASSAYASSGRTCAMYWSGPHDDHATPFSIDATHIENVVAAFQVGAEHFLVVTKPIAALPGQQKRGHALDGKLAVTLLEDGPNIDHGVDIFAAPGYISGQGTPATRPETRTGPECQSWARRDRPRRQRRRGASGHRPSPCGPGASAWRPPAGSPAPNGTACRSPGLWPDADRSVRR